MKIQNNVILVLMSLIIALTIVSCDRNWEQRSIWARPVIEQVEGAIGVPDGVYTGVGNAYTGEITVEVTIAGDAITKIEVLAHTDTASFANSVFTALIPEIEARQSTGVDLTAGATSTARGLVEAIEDALVSAGADLDNLRALAGGAAPAAAAPAAVVRHIDPWPIPDDGFIPGTYEGWGEGFGGMIGVLVTFEDDGIVGIEILEHSETPMFASMAFDAMIPAMEESGSAEVDIVSGATSSSYGLIEAVTDAAFGAEFGE